ncbi:MAG TPA: flagellar biosynthesis anti-sigma factor FlgM [Clostridiaceae bacterium]|nr:flagellar biosynthesis anti-sigma factor FlgM [Clostridiaceae bacterium]
MKIWEGVPRILGIYDKQKSINKVESTTPTSAKKDVVSISGQAKDYQIIKKALENVPDIRHEKIEQLARKYNSAGYRVDGRDVADKMLKSFIDKKI